MEITKPTKKQLIYSLAVIVFLCTLFIRLFIIEGFIVRGDSMYPTINDGDFVFVNKLAYKTHDPKRGDIIVAKPRDIKQKVLKRIIALPNERFEIVDNKVTIRERRLDAKQPLEELYLSTADTEAKGIVNIKLDPGEYFALGDNRSVSVDSRELGPLDSWDIKGKVVGFLSLKSLKYKGL